MASFCPPCQKKKQVASSKTRTARPPARRLRSERHEPRKAPRVPAAVLSVDSRRSSGRLGGLQGRSAGLPRRRSGGGRGLPMYIRGRKLQNSFAGPKLHFFSSVTFLELVRICACWTESNGKDAIGFCWFPFAATLEKYQQKRHTMCKALVGWLSHELWLDQRNHARGLKWQGSTASPPSTSD